jgi:uncharacterized protein
VARFIALLWLAITALAAPAWAQSFPERGRSPVVDQANLLSLQQEAELASRSEALFKQSGRQFVVATVNSLEGRDIEDYGYRLGRHWKLGDEQRDDGVILLVAPNEKKVRIETGYGAEGFLPDILAGRIIRNDILPRFRAGDMAGGIMAGADSIVRQMSLPAEEARETAAQAEAAESARNGGGGGFLPVVFWMMLIGFVLLAMARRGGGRRYQHSGKRGKRRGRGFDSGDAAIILWGLSELASASRKGRSSGWGGGFGGFGGGGWGGGGGGFGGFSGGGGSFGGGGASGSW